MAIDTGLTQGTLTDDEFDWLDEVNNCAYFVSSRAKSLLAVLREHEAADFITKHFVDFYFHVNELQEKGEAIARWALNSLALQHFPEDNDIMAITAIVKKLQKNSIEAEYSYRMLTSAGRPLGQPDEMNKMLATLETALQGMKEEIKKTKNMNGQT